MMTVRRCGENLRSGDVFSAEAATVAGPGGGSAVPAVSRECWI